MGMRKHGELVQIQAYVGGLGWTTFWVGRGKSVTTLDAIEEYIRDADNSRWPGVSPRRTRRLYPESPQEVLCD